MSVFNLYLWLFLLKTRLINTYNEARTIWFSGKGGWMYETGSAAIQPLLCGSDKVPLSSCYFVGVRKCRYPAATLWEWESAAIQLLLCGSEKVPLSSCYFVGVRKCRYPAATLWEWESAAKGITTRAHGYISIENITRKLLGYTTAILS